MKRTLSLILFVLMISLHGYSQVTFEASGQTNVAVGEQFMIRFTVNQQGSNFIGPDFKGLSVLSGPNLSTSTSYSNINGKMSQSMSVAYTYYLRAVNEGDFKVNPAKITVDGKEYKTDELTIHVGKQTAPANTNTNEQSNQGQTSLKENDLFIKASVDNKNPYQGEQVILTYKIYTKVPVAQIAINKLSNFQGFWTKNLLDQQQNDLKQGKEVINGEEYVTAELRKFAIFPQKSGKLTVYPMELECVAQIRQANKRRSSNSFLDDFFDDPFFGGTQNIQKILKSNPINLDVKPLPENNKPLDFSGTVGSFSLTGSINANQVKTNDAITLKLVVSGKGNLELIDHLNIKFPSDFEVYEPKITNNLNSAADGISGTRTFEYLLIPRNPGDFTIEPVTLSYYDIQKNSYQLLQTQAFNIKVEKGDDYQSGVVYSGSNREDIKYIGTDIHHIKTGQFTLNRINYYFFSTISFVLWIIVPFVLFLIFIFTWKKQSKKLSNKSLMRHKRATKVARRSLKNAQEYLGTKDSGSFYNEISQALWGYLSDKFSIPKAELSKESVKEKLLAKKVKEKSINQFIDTLNNCDYARFAPGDPESTMDKIYNEALEIISKIERELK